MDTANMVGNHEGSQERAKLGSVLIWILACSLLLGAGYFVKAARLRAVGIAEIDPLSIIPIKDVLIFHPAMNNKGGSVFMNSPYLFSSRSLIVENVNNWFLDFYRLSPTQRMIKFACLYEVTNASLWQFCDTLWQMRIAYLKAKNLCWSPAHIREFHRVPQVIASDDFVLAQGCPAASSGTMPLIAKHPTNGEDFDYKPSSLAIYKGGRLFLGGTGRTSSLFSLNQNPAQRFQSDANSEYPYPCQDDSANHSYNTDSASDGINRFFWCNDTHILIIVALFPIALIIGVCGTRRRILGVICVSIGLALACVGGFLLGFPVLWGSGLLETTKDNPCNQGTSQNSNAPHGLNTVPRKYSLTSTIYWGTVIAIGRAQMANVLDGKKQVAIISALAEGSSICSIERITGVQKP
jgi:hypothetical protein